MRFDRFAIALLTDDVSASRRFADRAPRLHRRGRAGLVRQPASPRAPGNRAGRGATDHDTLPEALRGRPTGGVSLAFVVADATAEHDRLTAAGLQILGPPIDMPWGQRRFHVVSPENVLLEVVQFTTPDPAWLAAHAE